MKTIAFIAAGEFAATPELLDRIKAHDAIIAVDGGLNHCHKYSLTPNLFVGDLDSVDPAILALYPHLKKEILPKEKDHTDLFLALEKAKEAEKITLFGALGKRIDHTLENLRLLAHYPKLSIETPTEKLFAIFPNAKKKIPSHPGQMLSLIPLQEPVCDVTTKGLKWELSHRDFTHEFSGISNLCLTTHVEIEIKSGVLLCSMIS